MSESIAARLELFPREDLSEEALQHIEAMERSMSDPLHPCWMRHSSERHFHMPGVGIFFPQPPFMLWKWVGSFYSLFLPIFPLMMLDELLSEKDPVARLLMLFGCLFSVWVCYRVIRATLRSIRYHRGGIASQANGRLGRFHYHHSSLELDPPADSGVRTLSLSEFSDFSEDRVLVIGIEEWFESGGEV